MADQLLEDASSAQPIDTGKRLEGVKSLMKAHNVSIYVVPTEDAHGSEYIAPCDARREFITGFTGSAGTALILIDQPQSLLFTDGRYFNQASKQLHPAYWKLMKQGLKDVPTWQEYLIKSAAEFAKKNSHPPSQGIAQKDESSNSQKIIDGLRIGIDPTLVSARDSDSLSGKLKEYSAQLVCLKDNLIDLQWASERPTRPHNPINILDLKYSGQATSEKLEKIRDRLKSLNDSQQDLIGMVVSALDEIAWCLNLRGSDISYNPVFFSYLWIDINQGVTLFIDEKQLDSNLTTYLKQNQVEIRPYESIWDFLQQLASSKLNCSIESKSKVLISPAASLAIQNHLGGKSNVSKIRSPIQDLKGIKNQTEIEGFRNAHIRDGAALVSYFAWLEETLSKPDYAKNPVNEYDAALQLEKFRKELGGEFFRGLSFETISSTGKNAAIIHYSPTKTDSAIIDKHQIYLCDSGAQYLDGTTDVTRTLHFDSPSEEERRAYTRVLQGHISLAQMIFPDKITGYQLDGFARQYLWQDGLDYRHGTGHGVGHYLNVHEGPHGIGSKPYYDQVSLKAGMTISNEPGYYKDEGFGIRIESIVVVKEVKFEQNESDQTAFLGFETVTLCPIQTKLLDLSLLSPRQVDWLNRYHQDVLKKLTPLLKDDPRALNWLIKECKGI